MNFSTSRLRRLMPELGLSVLATMDARTLYALAVLLVLVQLPHLLHLPIWVSALGIVLVVLRLVLLRKPEQRILKFALSPLSVTLLAALCAWLIKLDYGYFIGRDPSVAFLFILVAAKFAEVRKPSDATLLLCMAAFLLLTQYFYSQTILAAIVTLPAVIALAHCLAILRDPGNPARTYEQLKLVGTLLIQGLPLAALLFIVFPRLPGPLWSLPEDAMATSGLSDSMSPGSIGQLSQSDAVAFRVEFDGAAPEPRNLYWRGPVLSEFDGRNWSVSPLRLEARPRYEGDRDNIINYTVTLQPHRQRWLFALDTAVSLPHAQRGETGEANRAVNAAEGSPDEPTGGSINEPAGKSTGKPTDIAQSSGAQPASSQTARQLPPLARLMSDGQMIALSSVTQVLRYRQSSVLLNAVAPSRYPTDNTLFLPGRNPRTVDFAHQLRNSVDSNQAYARAVLRHFNQQSFYYTLQPQLLGDAPVDEFLFDTRSGFCEHYAAAFVVLMRGAGIPSRVVTGYLGGEMNEDYMIVRQSDAHAWAEAYIDGAWRRYDPTGAVAPSRVEQGLAAALPHESSVPRLARPANGWLRDAQLRWDSLNHQWQRLVIDFDNESQDNLWDRLGFSKPALWQITLIVLILAALWCAAVLGLPRFRRSKLPVDERLWRRLCQLLESHRLQRRPSETPAEYLQRASLRWPRQSERLNQLQQHFENLRFRAVDQPARRESRQWVRRELRSLQWALLYRSRSSSG